MDHVHLQLHIPIHIPARQSETCQRNDNNNKNNDLYGYYQRVQSRETAVNFNFKLGTAAATISLNSLPNEYGKS